MSISSPSKVEPDLREDYSTEALANAYNWYNYWQDSAKAKDYTINYLKEIEFSKEKIAAVKRIPENQFINSIGWNARILTLGGSLPDGYQDRMMLKLEKLISSDEPVSADDEIKAETEKVVSVQDRTKEKISNYIALLETELDNNYKDRDYTFNMYEWLSKNEIKPLVARAIADYFIPTYNERDNLPPIVARVRPAVPEADILVLDDNSPDGTGAIADQLASADAKSRVRHRPGTEAPGRPWQLRPPSQSRRSRSAAGRRCRCGHDTSRGPRLRPARPLAPAGTPPRRSGRARAAPSRSCRRGCGSACTDRAPRSAPARRSCGSGAPAGGRTCRAARQRSASTRRRPGRRRRGSVASGAE